MSACVQLHDVSMRRGGFWALLHVTGEISRGATVLLTGENGAGKTTLLRLLATLLQPTAGTVRVFGQDARRGWFAIRPRVALMTHQHQLYEALTPHENLRLHARLLGARASVDAVLERVGLAHAAHRPMRGFSAGMKRRAVLARVLLGEPELVLLDEPFGQLDPEGVALTEDVIRELQGRGATCVISTHDLERGRALTHMEWQLAAGRRAP